MTARSDFFVALARPRLDDLSTAIKMELTLSGVAGRFDRATGSPAY